MKKILERIKIYLNQKKTIPSSYPFVMYDEEKELLKRYISSSKKYLEFGLGGSTIFTLINSEAKITSVDTNVAWINFMKKYKIIKQSIPDRLKIVHIDIGPTKSWGFPVNNDHQDKFEDFSKKIFEIQKDEKYDFILVDGRFRVACALQAVINQLDNQELFIGVHDYSLRTEYSILEKFMDIVEFSKTLYVFKIKPQLDVNELHEVYEQYKLLAG